MKGNENSCYNLKMNPSCWASISAACHTGQFPFTEFWEKKRVFFCVWLLRRKFTKLCTISQLAFLISSKSTRGIQRIPSKTAIIILTSIFNSILARRERYSRIKKKNGLHTIAIRKVILNAEGLCVRNLFRIQSEREILWSKPCSLRRTHFELFKRDFFFRVESARITHSTILRPIRRRTYCFDRSRNMTFNPQCGRGSCGFDWLVGRGRCREARIWIYWGRKKLIVFVLV